ncbi:MAG: MFS transporter [Candidatus Lokiarchaeota archaeon]
MKLFKNKRALSITSLSHFLNDGNFTIPLLIYTFAINTIGISQFLIGIMMGSFFIASAIVSPIIGHFADKFQNPTRLISYGIFMWGIGIIILGFATSFKILPLMFIAVIIAGLSSAFYHPLGGMVLSSTYGEDAGSALGFNGSLGSIGRAIYPTITLFIFDILSGSLIDMTYTLLIMGLISLLASLPIFLVKIEYKPTKPIKKRIINEAPSKTMKNYALILILLTSIMLLMGLFLQGVFQFLPTILVKTFNYRYGIQLGLILTITLMAAVIGQPILGLISDKFGRKYSFFGAVLASLVFFFLFLHFHSLIWLACYGFFAFNSFPMILSLIGDLIPKRKRGFVNSFVWGLGTSGGGAIGPMLLGYLADLMGLLNATTIIIGLGLIPLILILFIPNPKNSNKNNRGHSI